MFTYTTQLDSLVCPYLPANSCLVGPRFSQTSQYCCSHTLFYPPPPRIIRSSKFGFRMWYSSTFCFTFLRNCGIISQAFAFCHLFYSLRLAVSNGMRYVRQFSSKKSSCDCHLIMELVRLLPSCGDSGHPRCWW